ncbi:glycosyltransferase family 39 protein [Adhaeribacter rhizoryzae]|uniref:Uncharacterized protein n=1 Tax=Adhaeribacter rhizoryzae TaxID=2607907 RepID=A0A5M6DL99_9BACT|nr:glycosyltransferase family 39 protein [Adhaeribacter rhizoryzae]KAA5548308.1 hypothetical protein F0145_06160 [Adhaeribacter rhizoryzae]
MKPYPGRRKLIALFLLAFTLKFLTAVFLRYLLSCAPLGYHLDELVIRGHDYFSYHAAMENYIQSGTYYFFNGKENVYAGRLPHFSLLYLFFRQFLNVAFADFMVLLVQLGTEAISIVVLALLVGRIMASRTMFYLTYLLCLLSWTVSFYSIIVLPDSLSVGLLIFFAYCFYSYLNRPSTKLLLLSGLLLAFVTVLKPHLGMLYLVVGFYFLKDFNFTTAKKLLETPLMF